MVLELTRIYNELVAINSDKIIFFERAEHVTSGRLENCTEIYLDDKRVIQVIEDFDFIMNCLEN